MSQLRELFTVRWSVFLLGPAGAGKTAVWRTLAAAQDALGEPTSVVVINPKSVSRDELYGCVHPSTREWRDGLVPRAFRDMAAADAGGGGGGGGGPRRHQWIVLDGDIDPEWIESMNTVMDDNKVLTLASNERVPLAPSMRLLLEVDSMAHCSPATVSRGGVIHVNGEDVGWRPVREGETGGGGREGEGSTIEKRATHHPPHPFLSHQVVDSWVARLPADLRPTITALVAK